MKVTEKNGYKISELTLGTVQLGIPYGINNTSGMPSYDEAAKILQAALDSGITAFDTAKNYGESEAVLGRFFRENPVEKTLITKVEFYDDNPADLKDLLFAKVRDSAQVLGVSKIPVVMLHSQRYLTTYGDKLTNAMKELKAEGLVDRLGISFSDKALLTELTDPNVYDCVQIPLNMFDSEEIRNGKIEELTRAGVSVFVRSVYLKGLFFMDTNRLPEKIKSAKPALDALKSLAEEQNMNMATLAMSFVKGTEGVESLVVGCETAEQLTDTVDLYVNKSKALSPAVTNRILEIAESVEPIVSRPWEWG